MPRPLKKDTLPAPGSSSPIACPTATPRAHFPTRLTSAAASWPRGARLPELGRARETQGTAPGRAPRAANGSPQSTTQHREKPRSTLQTSQARLAGVQARARLGQPLPAPQDKQRGMQGHTLLPGDLTVHHSLMSACTTH